METPKQPQETRENLECENQKKLPIEEISKIQDALLPIGYEVYGYTKKHYLDNRIVVYLDRVGSN